MVIQPCGRLSGQILIRHLEAHAITFSDRIRHSRNRLFGKPCQKRRRLQVAVSYVLSVCVEIPRIRQVTVHKYPHRKAVLGAELFPNPAQRRVLRVVIHKPVQYLPDVLT